MARENRGWGYDRILGALKNLGYRYSETTIARILRKHGIEPAPERKRKFSWNEFIKVHWDAIGAIDFTTVEVWTKGGLVKMFLFFAIELRIRRVHFAGCSEGATEDWMKQIARNLTDCNDGFFLGTRYVLMDRDTRFTEAFRRVLSHGDVTSVRLPARSPNLNAYMERFFRSLKSECLNRMIFLGEKSLRAAVHEFVEHYHSERNIRASRIA